MTRRTACAPNLEIVPRDRPLGRLKSDVREGSLEGQQLGARLQKLYPPCTEQQIEVNTLIVALDRRLTAL